METDIHTIHSIPADYIEDRALKVRIAEGDERAFALAVNRYSTPVYRFLIRMVNSNEDAQELTQETFLAFYTNREKLNPDVDIHPYLFTIARRKAISHLRWNKVRRILTPFKQEHENQSSSKDNTPAETLERKQTEELVKRSLEKLSPDKRAAVILRFFEGLSYIEIATVMNKPEGTVKSLVFRSEKELRRLLSHRLKAEKVIHDAE